MIPIGMASQHKLRQMEPAPITADEIPEFRDAVGSAFHNDTSEHYIERMRRTLEPERTLVLRDDGKIVAATGDLHATGSAFPEAPRSRSPASPRSASGRPTGGAAC